MLACKRARVLKRHNCFHTHCFVDCNFTVLPTARIEHGSTTSSAVAVWWLKSILAYSRCSVPRGLERMRGNTQTSSLEVSRCKFWARSPEASRLQIFPKTLQPTLSVMAKRLVTDNLEVSTPTAVVDLPVDELGTTTTDATVAGKDPSALLVQLAI